MQSLLLVDVNEPKHIREILKQHGIPFIVKDLETADYIYKNVGIERKLGDDFYVSLVDRRLLGENGQCARMVREFEIPAIAFIGSVARLYHKNPNWVASSMREILLGYKIPVIPFDTDDTFARWLVSMVHHGNEIGRFTHEKPVKTKGEMSVPTKMLMQVPGVGPEKAKAIMEKYKAIINIVNLIEDEGIDVEGIGQVLTQNIWDALFK